MVATLVQAIRASVCNIQANLLERVDPFEVHIAYAEVIFELTRYDAGGRVTDRDVEVAKKHFLYVPNAYLTDAPIASCLRAFGCRRICVELWRPSSVPR